MTGTNTFTSTDLQYIINTVWSPKVEREMQANLVAASFFTDFSDMLSGGGSTLDLTEIFTNKLSANTKSNGSEVTLQSPATGQLSLTVDTWKEVSFLIEDKEAQLVLQNARIAQEYADQAKYIIAKTLDSAILANYATLSQTVSDTATDVTDSIIRQAIGTLGAADVPFDQLAFFFHPTVVWQDLMGSAKYTNAYQSGVNPSAIVTGNFGTGGAFGKARMGTLYGIPVYQTSQVPADGASSAFYNLLASPRAYMFATRTPGGNYVRSISSYQHPNLGTLWTNDCLYGTAELRDVAGVVIKSRQSGIVS